MKRRSGEGSYGEKIIKGVKYKYYRFPDGKYIYAKTAKELQQKKDGVSEKKKEEAYNVDSNKFTFGSYSLEWLKKIKNDISERTYDDYESIVNCRIIKYKDYDLNNKQIQSLTVEMLNSYLTSLSKKYAKKTIDKTWTIISMIVKDGMKDKKMPFIDFSDIKIPKEKDVKVKKKEIPIVTLKDMDYIYDEANKKYSNGVHIYGNNAKIIIFIMYSGLRISEAIGLTWKYVAEDFSSITIKYAATRVIKRDKEGNPVKTEDNKNVYISKQKDPKSEKGNRVIPLPDRAIEVIKYMYDNYNHSSDDYVFVSSSGKKMSIRNIEKTLTRIVENSKCKEKGYTPHCLRHGYGSMLISNGVDIKLVSELLGHAKVSTTYDIYIGILKEDKINAVKNVFNKK